MIPKLPMNMLGRTGLNVARLGYGSMGLRGPRTWGVRVVSEADAEQMLNQVLRVGVNFIDTAPDYGIAEERIGRYLSHRRQEFFIATKCGCDYQQQEDSLEIRHTWNEDVVKRNLDQSLVRLKTDSIDLLQFHGGDAETLQRTGLIRLLEGFREQGLVGAIGVSTSLPQLPALWQLGVFDAFQILYSILAPEHHDWITRIAQSGAGVIVRGGIAQGGPDAEIQRQSVNDAWSQAKLDELLPQGMSRAELLLRATLSHPHVHVVIAGTANPAHLQSNVAAALAGPLPAELYQAILQRIQR